MVGSAHSKCDHPKNAAVMADPMARLMSTLASVGRSTPIFAETGLNIKCDLKGISRGWFNWPYNYDPVWLLNCDGFVEKES